MEFLHSEEFTFEETRVLKSIREPADVAKLKQEELSILASACRKIIIDSTSKAGGHLSSSLGTVEITISLFNCFNLDKDYLVWDVGHQAYTHKILTNRAHLIPKIGTREGVAKFLRIAESKYDHFGAGHASTSISAGLGMMVSSNIQQFKNKVICVIGDGALTGGMAYEAMNHAGYMKIPLLVVLNDNDMSIEPNVGALSKAFNLIQTNKYYNRLREDISKFGKSKSFISQLVSKGLKRFNHSFMEFLSPGLWFEKLGFRYLGPIDGHDFKALIETFKAASLIEGPVLIHAITKKGKGYEFAEEDSLKYHGVTPFETKSGKFVKSSGGKTYSSVWSDALIQLMDKDEKVVAVSAAMIASTGLKEAKEKYENRVFDVGIAEQHAVTFSAGMASKGLKPFTAIYSTFLQRAIDQLIHDVALQNLPVRFIIDRAGFVGADGATHHGIFDFTYGRMIPNMTIMSPSNGFELHSMVKLMHDINSSPSMLRFPRGNCDHYPTIDDQIPLIEIGKANQIYKGNDFQIWFAGTHSKLAEEVRNYFLNKNIDVGITDARFVKPIDYELLLEDSKRVKGLITIEENVLAGGFGSAILEYLMDSGVNTNILRFGIPDHFIEYGSVNEQITDSGLDFDSIIKKIESHFLI